MGCFYLLPALLPVALTELPRLCARGVVILTPLSLFLLFKVGQAILFTKETYVKGLLPIDISPLK